MRLMGCGSVLAVGSFLLVLRPATAAISWTPAGHPDYPGVCVHPLTGEKLAENTTWRVSDCGLGSCLKSNDQMGIQLEYCLIPPPVPKRCSVTSDMSKVFPQCCKVVVCPQGILNGQPDADPFENSRDEDKTAQKRP